MNKKATNGNGNKYRVRFHLARGPNYLHWQVKSPDGSVTYHNPDMVRLVMLNARLHNRPNVAKTICRGANKTVCAWIECDWVGVTAVNTVPFGKNAIMYNPRKLPHWTDKTGQDLDNKKFDLIVSNEKFLYTNLKLTDFDNKNLEELP